MGLVYQLIAASTALLCVLCVLASIAAGWFVLWHLVLHRVGFLREVLGLNNRDAKKAAKRQVEHDIQELRRQMGMSS